MPTYSYKCECGEVLERYYPRGGWSKSPKCKVCGLKTKIQIKTPEVKPPIKTIGSLADRNTDRLSEEEKKNVMDTIYSGKNACVLSKEEVERNRDIKKKTGVDPYENARKQAAARAKKRAETKQLREGRGCIAEPGLHQKRRRS